MLNKAKIVRGQVRMVEWDAQGTNTWVIPAGNEEYFLAVRKKGRGDYWHVAGPMPAADFPIHLYRRKNYTHLSLAEAQTISGIQLLKILNERGVLEAYGVHGCKRIQLEPLTENHTITAVRVGDNSYRYLISHSITQYGIVNLEGLRKLGEFFSRYPAYISYKKIAEISGSTPVKTEDFIDVLSQAIFWKRLYGGE